MATTKKPTAKPTTKAKPTGSVKPLGNRTGNPGSKADWKSRKAAMDRMIDGKR